MKPAVYYAKVSILFLFLFLESYFLSKIILNFIKNQTFLMPAFDIYGIIILAELILIITNALTIGAWKKWEQFVFTPIPILGGITFVILPLNFMYTFIFIFISYLIICIDLFLAGQLKEQMLVFNPRLILKFTSKAISLVFSMLAALLVILNAQRVPSISIGSKVGEIFDKYFMPKISYQIDTQVDSVTEDQRQKLSAFGLDPNQLDTVEKSGIFSSVLNSELSLKSVVSKEVDNLVEPYKRFFNPIIAILVFTLFQFLGSIAFFMYTLVVDAVFWVAKKSNFIKIELVPAEKEVVHF